MPFQKDFVSLQTKRTSKDIIYYEEFFCVLISIVILTSCDDISGTWKRTSDESDTQSNIIMITKFHYKFKMFNRYSIDAEVRGTFGRHTYGMSGHYEKSDDILILHQEKTYQQENGESKNYKDNVSDMSYVVIELTDDKMVLQSTRFRDIILEFEKE